MSFDAFTISAMVDELSDKIVAGRVQDVIDVDAMGLGLEIYADHQRCYLYMSADAMHPRIHLVDKKLRRGLTKPTQLGLLFRRYIEGGIVTQISQPAWERLLEIEVEGRDGVFRIIVELMPRRANLLLVRNGVILDCMNRVGPEDNRYRLSLPNHDYVPPPPIRGQLDPATLSEHDILQLLKSADKDSTQTRRLLPGRILGMSPLLAKEIVYRASGAIQTKAGDTDSASLYAAFQTLVGPLLKRHWRPGTGSQHGVPADFSAFALTHLDWTAYDTLSAAITGYYGAITGIDAYDEAKKPVQAAIDEAKAKLEAKLASLRQGLRDDSELERLKQSGELILAYQYALTDDQRELRAQYDLDAPELAINLNPDLDPLGECQRLFPPLREGEICPASCTRAHS